MKAQLKSWLGPLGLALLSALFGFYLLLGPAPRNHFVDAESSSLDAELLQYFTILAENYAKEGAENTARAHATKKADPI